MTELFRIAAAVAVCLASAACGGGVDSATTAATGTTTTTADPITTPSTGSFALTSSAFAEGGTYASTYTCDGARSTPPLAWANAPAGTKAFVLLMKTQPDSSSTKWNWVLYNIPSTTTALSANTSGVGTLGAADDGAGTAYAPPCSQGPGAKTYTFTLYALSALPTLSTTVGANTGAVVTAAIASLKLGAAALSVTATRTTTGGTTPSTSATNCALIQASVANYAAAGVSVDCSASDYGKLASTGLPSHAMMNGITATNLQVPLPTNFTGSNAWTLPLTPAIATSTTSVNDGPIGVAVNGVPIFNPCKQGGCTNGDTKVLGELDVCNGHAGRADDYHYHAAPTCLMADQAASYWDTHPIGWALDGFAIFGYNNADGTTATRDAVCGGNTLMVPNAPVGYSYHLTDASPYVLSCLRGTPSPDLANQGSKYSPLRQPPVTPFPVANMTLTTDSTDGYQVLQFTSARSFTSTETGTDSYTNAAGSYRVRYKPVTGTELATLLALSANGGKTACWNFQFTSATAATTQPTVSYCR
jgi:phosphatidylethanolamine-binding protein (PEBP) family uncharacterized protein